MEIVLPLLLAGVVAFLMSSSTSMVLRPVAALYVDAVRGPYGRMPGVEAWGFPERDAMAYAGPWPVVAHPPCACWGAFKWRCERAIAAGDVAKAREKMTGPRAVQQVRTWGGVLEHPAKSGLWAHAGLPRPGEGRDAWGGWSMEIDQARWGHPAEKKTWLYFCGVEPEDLPSIPPWRAPTHVIARGKNLCHMSEEERETALPDLPKSKRHLSPPAFAAWLVEVARRAKGVEDRR